MKGDAVRHINFLGGYYALPRKFQLTHAQYIIFVFFTLSEKLLTLVTSNLFILALKKKSIFEVNNVMANVTNTY